MYREYLQKMIGFNKWHLGSLEGRRYALPMIRRINELLSAGGAGEVIEIGCGLGDIISAIHWKNKMGYDIDKKAILAARILHPQTLFRVGTFDEVRDKKIAVLIALNFLHSVNDEDCCRYFCQLFYRNEISLVVVDDVSSPPYRYSHDYEKLFGQFGYVLEYKSRGYEASGHARRRILYFRKALQNAVDEKKLG